MPGDVVRLQKTESAMVALTGTGFVGCRDRVERLMTIPQWGRLRRLTWALEVGDVAALLFDQRPSAIAGCAGREEFRQTRCKPARRCQNSATNICNNADRGGQMAPRNSADLAMLYDKEKQKGQCHRATLAVARKLVAYLVAVDRRQKSSYSRKRKPYRRVTERPEYKEDFFGAWPARSCVKATGRKRA